MRGAGRQGFSRIITDLRNTYHFDIIAILEPRISGSKAKSVIKKIGFFQQFCGGCGRVFWGPLASLEL